MSMLAIDPHLHPRATSSSARSAQAPGPGPPMVWYFTYDYRHKAFQELCVRESGNYKFMLGAMTGWTWHLNSQGKPNIRRSPITNNSIIAGPSVAPSFFADHVHAADPVVIGQVHKITLQELDQIDLKLGLDRIKLTQRIYVTHQGESGYGNVVTHWDPSDTQDCVDGLHSQGSQERERWAMGIYSLFQDKFIRNGRRHAYLIASKLMGNFNNQEPLFIRPASKQKPQPVFRRGSAQISIQDIQRQRAQSKSSPLGGSPADKPAQEPIKPRAPVAVMFAVVPDQPLQATDDAPGRSTSTLGPHPASFCQNTPAKSGSNTPVQSFSSTQTTTVRATSTPSIERSNLNQLSRSSLPVQPDMNTAPVSSTPGPTVTYSGLTGIARSPSVGGQNPRRISETSDGSRIKIKLVHKQKSSFEEPLMLQRSSFDLQNPTPAKKQKVLPSGITLGSRSTRRPVNYKVKEFVEEDLQTEAESETEIGLGQGEQKQGGST